MSDPTLLLKTLRLLIFMSQTTYADFRVKDQIQIFPHFARFSNVFKQKILLSCFVLVGKVFTWQQKNRKNIFAKNFVHPTLIATPMLINISNPVAPYAY